MELTIDWGIVAQLLIAALIAMAWSFLMASKVAPRFVTRTLMRHLNNLDDPEDEIAGAMRRGAGLVMGGFMRQVKEHPEMLSPVVGAFWQNIKRRAAGQKGGRESALGEGLDADSLVEIALQEGPDALAGIAEMFGVSGRTAAALGRVGSRYVAGRLSGGNSQAAGLLGTGQNRQNGAEWWEQQ